MGPDSHAGYSGDSIRGIPGTVYKTIPHEASAPFFAGEAGDPTRFPVGQQKPHCQAVCRFVHACGASPALPLRTGVKTGSSLTY